MGGASYYGPQRAARFWQPSLGGSLFRPGADGRFQRAATVRASSVARHGNGTASRCVGGRPCAGRERWMAAAASGERSSREDACEGLRENSSLPTLGNVRGVGQQQLVGLLRSGEDHNNNSTSCLEAADGTEGETKRLAGRQQWQADCRRRGIKSPGYKA